MTIPVLNQPAMNPGPHRQYPCAKNPELRPIAEGVSANRDRRQLAFRFRWAGLFLAVSPLIAVFEILQARPTGAAIPVTTGGTPFGDYQIETWTSDRGLPQNTVQCLLQATNGYLWIGTQSGLARYDGLHFRIFDRQNTTVLKTDNILCLAEDLAGSLWIGTADGLVRLRGHQFDRFSTHRLAPAAESRQVWAIGLAAAGDPWVGVGALLTKVQGDHLSVVADFGEQVYSVLCDRSGRLWVATSAGLYCRSVAGTNWTAISRGAIVHTVFQDSQNIVGFGTEGALWQSEGGRLRALEGKDGLSGGPVRRVAEDAQGALWLVVGGRLNRLQDGRCTVPGGPAGLVNDEIECVYPDREQNVWLGTSHSGLIRLRPRQVLTYTTRDGLVNDDVSSICEGRKGDMWLATYHGLSRLADEQFFNCPTAFPPVFEDRGGTLWFATHDALGFRRPGENADQSLSFCAQINTIYQDRSQILWVAAAQGLWRLEGNQCDLYAVRGVHLPSETNQSNGRQYTLHTNALPAAPLAVLQDRRGDLWVGSKGGGLQHLTNGHFTTLMAADGLTSDYAGPLLADPDGTLWVGSDKGLNSVKEGRITRYTTSNGLAENIVGNLLEDDAGWFWSMGHRGLHRFRKQELIEVANGTRHSIRTVSYGASDGLLSAEANVGLFPNACRTGDGLLWFPTTRGVLVIEPHEFDTHELPPPVVLEQVLADDEIIFGDGADAHSLSRGPQKSADSRLAPGRARLLEFRYTASTFVAPEQVRFRYKLEGYEQQWREAGAQRTAIYNDIAPGAYRFRVLAVNSKGVESASAAEFAFALAPHFYQTPYFYGASVLSVLLTGIGLHRVRIGTLARRQAVEQQLALALQRERIAKDMHDDLGSSLTQIGFLSEQARRRAASSPELVAQIERIAVATRQTAQAAEEMVWVVSPRHDSLDSLATYLSQFAREYLEPTGIRCRLEVPEQFPEILVPSDMRHNLVLFVKEAINNAVKHSGARELWLTLDYKRQVLTIRIADNGCGFRSPQAQREALAEGAGTRNGLVNLRKRAEASGGEFELSSEPGKGTRVSVRVTLGL